MRIRADCGSDVPGTAMVSPSVTVSRSAAASIVIQALRSRLNAMRPLLRCKSALRRFAVGGASQALRYDEKHEQDRGVDRRDRDHADGEVVEVVVEVGAEDVAEARRDP